MGLGVGSFLQLPVGAPPLVVEETVYLGSLALGKIKGL